MSWWEIILLWFVISFACTLVLWAVCAISKD